MDETPAPKERKKSKLLLIIIIIIILLLIGLALWFFIFRDKGGEVSDGGSKNNGGESGKVVDDKPKDKKTTEYNYKDGVLTPIVDEDGNPKQTEFIIDGLILIGNHHSYYGEEEGSESTIEKAVKDGYKKEGINSSFYLNEWIEIYLDTKYAGNTKNVDIVLAPHKTVEEWEKMTKVEVMEYALQNGGYTIVYETPDAENYKYINNGYVNADYPAGKYDLLFFYKDKLAYFVNLSLTKEE